VRPAIRCTYPSFTVIAVLAASVVGCAPKDESVSIKGVIAGRQFAAVDGFADAPGSVYDSFQGRTQNSKYVHLYFVEQPVVCQSGGAAEAYASSEVVEVTLWAENIVSGEDAPAPVPDIRPGRYAATSTRADEFGLQVSARAQFVVLDRECNLDEKWLDGSDDAVGFVDISKVGTSIAGTLDLTFPSGSHIAGRFDVPVCVARPDPSQSATCVTVN